MTLTRRAALIVLLLGLALLLGFFLRGFLLEVVVKPVALVVWLFGRTVQSVHQLAYWGILIGSAAIYALLRLAPELADSPPAPPSESNVTLDQIEQWRALIPLSADEIGKPGILKHNLGRMLAAIFTSRQTEAVHWEIDEALRSRRIPLPDGVHAFLFPAGPPEEESSLRRNWRALRRAPGQWIRRLTGRDTAEYYRSIEEVLAYMEYSMEKKHDE
jgi:hypothetical protein